MSNKSSSRSSASSHRPKLARASATAPSLATSNASRQDLANLQSSRASELLSRVASYSGSNEHSQAHSSYGTYGSPSSLSSSPEQRSPASDLRKRAYEVVNYQHSSNYFSFPSFDDFQDYQQRREGGTGVED